jgi:hypothetical protein
MRVQRNRVAVGFGNDEPQAASLPWRPATPYRTRAELCRQLDDLRTTLPAMTDDRALDGGFWPAFQREAESIKRSAMGFDIDYVVDRIEAMTTALRPTAGNDDRND